MVKIQLHVYHLIASDNKAQTLTKDALDIIGLGIHHSGLAVYGQEISFGADPTGRNDPSCNGIFKLEPMTACSHFKEQIELGDVALTEEKLEGILVALAPNWKAASYQLLSHNCNYFTYALAEAIDPTLLALYPKYINRIAQTGSMAVPTSLVNMIMNAVNPPMACAPDLINIIDVPSIVAEAPPKMPSQPIEGHPEVSSPRAPPSPSQTQCSLLGGFMQKAKKVATVAATHVRARFIAAVDAKDIKDFGDAFPVGSLENSFVFPEDLISAYTVTVIHINRLQMAKFFITADGLWFKGSNGLSRRVPYSNIRGIVYGTMVMPTSEQGSPLPTYTICHNHDNGNSPDVNCVLVFVSGIANTGASSSKELRTIPLSGFAFGHLARRSNVLRNATGYIDGLWKASME